MADKKTIIFLSIHGIANFERIIESIRDGKKIDTYLKELNDTVKQIKEFNNLGD